MCSRRLPSTVHMASRGSYLKMSPTTSYGQPRTGHRDVPHPFIWSATDYTTEHHLLFVKQLGSTATENKFTTTAKFRKQRHGQVHLGATGGPLFPDASATV